VIFEKYTTYNMEGLTARVDSAVNASDYATLASLFSGFSSPWQSLGQGEQRTLASYFIKAAVASDSFLPAAFGSPAVIEVMEATLTHLPPTVEDAADNQLRQGLFEYKVSEEQDYAGAAKVLSGLRMEDTPGSVYFMSPHEICDGKRMHRSNRL
jgi:COP9 signalosome complex subunit 4